MLPSVESEATKRGAWNVERGAGRVDNAAWSVGSRDRKAENDEWRAMRENIFIVNNHFPVKISTLPQKITQ